MDIWTAATDIMHTEIAYISPVWDMKVGSCGRAGRGSLALTDLSDTGNVCLYAAGGSGQMDTDGLTEQQRVRG